MHAGSLKTVSVVHVISGLSFSEIKILGNIFSYTWYLWRIQDIWLNQADKSPDNGGVLWQQDGSKTLHMQWHAGIQQVLMLQTVLNRTVSESRLKTATLKQQCCRVNRKDQIWYLVRSSSNSSTAALHGAEKRMISMTNMSHRQPEQARC